MTAGDYHPQLLIPYRGRGKRLVDEGRHRPLALEQPTHLGREGARGAFAPPDVKRAVLRRRHEPRGRVLRDAASPPHLQRSAEGVLGDVFRKRQVVQAEDSRERGNHAPRLAPEELFAQIQQLYHLAATFLWAADAQCRRLSSGARSEA